jgi:hypothetical protein
MLQRALASRAVLLSLIRALIDSIPQTCPCAEVVYLKPSSARMEDADAAPIGT